MQGVIPFKTLFTGQHEDMVYSNPDYSITIENKNNRLDSVIASIMNSVDFHKESITHVLVQGDTATAYATALSAFNIKIPVIHLEAGMRSYDKRMPEEKNRVLIDHIATVNLPYIQYCRENLIRENIHPSSIYVVGNPIFEVINHYLPMVHSVFFGR